MNFRCERRHFLRRQIGIQGSLDTVLFVHIKIHMLRLDELQFDTL